MRSKKVLFRAALERQNSRQRKHLAHGELSEKVGFSKFL